MQPLIYQGSLNCYHWLLWSIQFSYSFVFILNKRLLFSFGARDMLGKTQKATESTTLSELFGGKVLLKISIQKGEKKRNFVRIKMEETL